MLAAREQTIGDAKGETGVIQRKLEPALWHSCDSVQSDAHT